MNKIHYALIAAIIAIVIVFVFTGIKKAEETVYIGVLKDDDYLFEDSSRIENTLHRNVEIIYYDSYDEMLPDILSEKLSIFERSLLDFLSSTHESKIVAAIPTDYILAGTVRSDVSQIGVTESHISSLLIDTSTTLKEKKISILKISEKDILPYLEEQTIDFAVFRNTLPENIAKDITEDTRLSSLHIQNDVLVVKDKLLEAHDELPDAIFQSFNPECEELQKLPSKDEIKNAVNYLFKIGSIKQRGLYEDYVHK